MGLSYLCVCVCVSVCFRFFRSHKSYLNENQKCKKWRFKILTFVIEWRYCENCIRVIKPILQGQTYQMAILTSKRSKIKHCYCHRIESQVFAIKWHHWKCCKSWPWHTFSRSRFLKCEYHENEELAKNTQESRITFKEVNSCHRPGPLWMLYS